MYANSASPASQPKSMDPGFLKFAAHTPPPLPHGTYTLHVEQSTTIPNCTLEPAAFSFTCQAPALTLPPDDVYSVYPPKDSFGKFELTLPHVVLKRRTLPWERTLIPDANLPWMALLLYDETEQTVLQSLPTQQALQPERGIYCPMTVQQDLEPDCLVLDVPIELFCDTFPTGEDLLLSAHARGVSRSRKVTEAQPVDEWLSVLLCNRYPASNTGPNGVKNTVYLVSCEGFAPFLQDCALRGRIRDSGEYHTARIPVLSSWDFYSYREDFDFKTAFLSLSAGPLALPAEGLSDPEAIHLLSMGFAPLDHLLRNGDHTVSWYRSPLLPYACPFESHAPQFFADARLIYEPEMGMFDLSYSAAFTLGRQLALQSGAFSTALLQWRQSNKQLAARRLESNMTAQQLNLPPLEGANGPENMEQQMLALVEEAAQAVLERGNRDEQLD